MGWGGRRGRAGGGRVWGEQHAAELGNASVRGYGMSSKQKVSQLQLLANPDTIHDHLYGLESWPTCTASLVHITEDADRH